MLGWQVRDWRTLPEPGGLRDQRAGEMDRLATVLRVYNALCAWKDCPPDKIKRWINAHPGEWAIRKWVIKIREGTKVNG